MNFILVILDTLRPDHVGCYGSRTVRTPCLDALARESIRFDRAYPEVLPTLPSRRALHTGMRVFPFRENPKFKGDFVAAPGWGPIDERLETVSELLSAASYRTALITDTYHQFKPSKNFHRGFSQWTWIRGQEADRCRSGPLPSVEEAYAHIPPQLRPEGASDHPAHRRASLVEFIRRWIMNRREWKREEDYLGPQVFREGIRWLEDNRDAEKFFLVVDSFDPHEPWDPPPHYRRLYDPEELPVNPIFSLYGPASRFSPREIKRLRANYAAEVTMVDRWLGEFVETARRVGRLEDTLLIVVSDHGHCIGEQNLVSKQGHPMCPEVADLVLLVRRPGGEGGGKTVGAMVQHHDIPATILDLAGVKSSYPLDGQSLAPLLQGGTGGRDHATVGWGPFILVREGAWWYNAYHWGEAELLYDLAEDPGLVRNLAALKPDVCRRLRELAREDAGGDFPAYLREMADARIPGCTPLSA